MRMLTILVGASLVFATACDDRSYREIGAAIDVLTKKRDGLPGPAIERLKAIGRRSVPQLETAMHTAPMNGKLQIIAALDAIGEPESAAILGHFGAYDPQAPVRAACEEVLRRWAGDRDPRSAAARAALRSLNQKRMALAKQ